MTKQWSKTSAFAHFGARMTNTRWSWSGISNDAKTVVIVLWQDGVKGREGLLTYDDTVDLDGEWRKRPGHSERIVHLKLCRDELGGRFRAVIARAVDANADPREIATCHPQQDVWWQLNEFDETTGAFRAHVAPNSGR